MNRRTFTAASFAAVAFPMLTSAQTPVGSPVATPDTSDGTARDIITLMDTIPAVELLDALESADITNQDLIDASDGADPTPIPWDDMSDDDLKGSLGGVVIAAGETDIHGSDEAALLGWYIVYETADIAKSELDNKLASLGEDDANMTQVGGTNLWQVSTEGMTFGLYRIGYVIGLAVDQGDNATAAGMIHHLLDVAESIAG